MKSQAIYLLSIIVHSWLTVVLFSFGHRVSTDERTNLYIEYVHSLSKIYVNEVTICFVIHGVYILELVYEIYVFLLFNIEKNLYLLMR